MTDPLHVQTDGVLNYSQLHSDVAAGLSGLADVDGSGVETSHGQIASAVSTALSQVLAGRQSTLGVTSTAASTISDLLQKAAQAYAAGDQQGAERLRAAADVLEGKEPTGRSGGAPTSGGGSTGGDTVGQVLGQVGQQVGQLAQSIAQPLQGLAQGLQQIPQQIMQGVQQAGQGLGGGVDLRNAKDEEDDRRAEDKSKEKRESDRDESEPSAEATASIPAERAPVDIPAPRQRPAATHPQAD